MSRERPSLPFDELACGLPARCELADGTLLVSPLAPVRHQVCVARLMRALAEAAPPELTVLTGVGVARPGCPDRWLSPDVAVVGVPALVDDPVSVRPDDVYLAAEVASPASRSVDLHLKQRLYAEWRIGAYWVLDPDSRRVHRFRAAGAATGWVDEVDLTGWADA